MKRHSGLHGFPGGGKFRLESSARSGRSAVALVEPMKGLHEASRPIPVLSRGREIASGHRCTVRSLGGCSCEADEGPS